MKRLISVIVCAFCAISINAATIHVPGDQHQAIIGIINFNNFKAQIEEDML